MYMSPMILANLFSRYFIFNVGKGMLYFLHDLWYSENLVLPAKRKNLFVENHSLILILNNVFMLLCSKKILYRLRIFLE